jgi:hypothetical protein
MFLLVITQFITSDVDLSFTVESGPTVDVSKVLFDGRRTVSDLQQIKLKF